MTNSSRWCSSGQGGQHFHHSLQPPHLLIAHTHVCLLYACYMPAIYACYVHSLLVAFSQAPTLLVTFQRFYARQLHQLIIDPKSIISLALSSFSPPQLSSSSVGAALGTQDSCVKGVNVQHGEDLASSAPTSSKGTV